MSNSTAILLAGAMLALGVFFGLRSLAPSAPAAPPTAEPPPAPPPPSPAPVLDAAVARERVANALAYHRDRLTRDCYLPAVAGETPPPRVALEFDFTFDAEGGQLMRGVVEDPEAAREAVTQCVLANLPPLRIRPPGQTVRVTIPLSFP